MDPNERVNPAIRTQAFTVQIYLNAGSEVNDESKPRMMTLE